MLGRFEPVGFHDPCLGLPGRCATRWGETGITNRPLVLDVPEAAACLEKCCGFPPNVILAYGDTLTMPAVNAFHLIVQAYRGLHPCIVNPIVTVSHLCCYRLQTLRPGRRSPVTPASLCQLRFFRCDLVAYGQLLLATYERMMTGGLSACDWLMPVTWLASGSSRQCRWDR